MVELPPGIDTFNARLRISHAADDLESALEERVPEFLAVLKEKVGALDGLLQVGRLEEERNAAVEIARRALAAVYGAHMTPEERDEHSARMADLGITVDWTGA